MSDPSEFQPIQKPKVEQQTSSFGSRWDRLELRFVLFFATSLYILFLFFGFNREIISIPSFLILTILFLRNQHANEVYWLLLIYFLTAYLGFMVLFYVDVKHLIDIGKLDYIENNTIANTDDMVVNILKSYVVITSDLGSELKFLSILIGVIVIPQVSTFLVAGIFGCAKPPALVSSVAKFSTMSLVKSLCAFSAIRLSTFLFLLFKHVPKLW